MVKTISSTVCIFCFSINILDTQKPHVGHKNFIFINVIGPRYHFYYVGLKLIIFLVHHVQPCTKWYLHRKFHKVKGLYSGILVTLLCDLTGASLV